MFEFNATDIVQTLQTADYYGIIYNMITETFPELLVFTIGILFYAVFIWFFYRYLSKRDLFKLDLSKYNLLDTNQRRVKKAGSVFLYILKYGIVFPLYVGFWFTILTIFLFVMAKNVTVRQAALISIALVSTVRITSYLKEELSRDLAKLVPLALLAIFLTDPNFFSLELLIERVGIVPSLGMEVLKFLAFCILLEWGLRTLFSIKRAYRPKSTPTENQ